MAFKSIAALEAKLKSDIKASLASDVYKAVIEAEQDAIDEVVYSAYTPRMYSRREADGGLQDPANMVGSMNGMTLSVRNETPASGQVLWICDIAFPPTSDKDLPAVVEYGIKDEYDMYPISLNRSYANPRPFTEQTVDDLKENQAHVDALKAGLASRGWTVR